MCRRRINRKRLLGSGVQNATDAKKRKALPGSEISGDRSKAFSIVGRRVLEKSPSATNVLMKSYKAP